MRLIYKSKFLISDLDDLNLLLPYFTLLLLYCSTTLLSYSFAILLLYHPILLLSYCPSLLLLYPSTPLLITIETAHTFNNTATDCYGDRSLHCHNSAIYILYQLNSPLHKTSLYLHFSLLPFTLITFNTITTTLHLGLCDMSVFLPESKKRKKKKRKSALSHRKSKECSIACLVRSAQTQLSISSWWCW